MFRFMKSGSLIAIVLAISVLLSGQPNLEAATGGGANFDGSWSVTVDAKAYKNPNGSIAEPYVWRFPATVKNGVLYGEHGTKGTPNSCQLSGKIESNGSAGLRIEEITGHQKHNMSSSLKPPPGEGYKYSYQVVAHFDIRSGTGHSTDKRTRIFTFTKE